jgi:hypothetical protein
MSDELRDRPCTERSPSGEGRDWVDGEIERRYDRARKVVNLQRPDRLPYYGRDLVSVEYRTEEYHLGEPEFVEHMGQVVVSQDGRRRYTRDGGVWAVGDRDRFQAHDDVLSTDPKEFGVEPVGLEMLSEMARLYAEKAQVGYPVPWHYGTLVTRAVLEFGWEPFLMAAGLDPQRLGMLLDRFGQASLAVARGWAETEGTELIIIHDDIAGTHGVFMRPDWYRQYVFPWYARVFEAIHERGRKVLYLSDGNYMQVLDDILDTDPDGLYIESSSMDPATLMREAGPDKLYLLKTDSRVIDFGTPEDIRAELSALRALHSEYPGIMMYRGGGNPRPGNAEAFERYYCELLVYS